MSNSCNLERTTELLSRTDVCPVNGQEYKTVTLRRFFTTSIRNGIGRKRSKFTISVMTRIVRLFTLVKMTRLSRNRN